MRRETNPSDFYAGDEESLLQPDARGWKAPHGGVLLLPFQQHWTRAGRAAFTAPALAAGIKLQRLRRSPWTGLTFYRARRRESVWLLALCPIGSPATAFAAEYLWAGGVETILFFGFCGSLLPSVNPGDLVVASGTIREEGVSHHYLPADEEAASSPALLESMTSALRESDVSFTEGKIWTTDVPFRETRSKAERHRSAGAVAVEMEVAALFAVCAHRNMNCGALLSVTEPLAGDEWTGFQRMAGLQGWARACRTSVFDLLG